VGRERRVIPGYNEPNTPPNGPVSDAVRAVIADPAAIKDGVLNLNQAIYVRFFDRARAIPPRAILILVPGIIAGANVFNVVASQIVQRSQGEVEVWAIDRRANLLEDASAMIMAETTRTPEASLQALEFYLNDADGRGGYIANHPTEVHGFLAEWGLDVHLRDLKAVVDEARRAQRGVRPKVFLGGHDFVGADLVALFAAYNFDGTPGYTLLDGLLLLDGAPAVAASPRAPQIRSDDEYLNSGVVLQDTLRIPGLNRLRNPQGFEDAPFVVGDIFGPFSFQLVEIIAQLALFAPEDASPLPGDLAPPVPSTNAATLGINVDDEFAPQKQTRFSIGFLQLPPGGAVSSVAVPMSDPGMANPNGIFTPRNLGMDASGRPILQRWASLRDLSTIGLRGREFSDLALVAKGFLFGDGEGATMLGEANAVEWFFPRRLLLDILLAARLDTANLSPQVVEALTARGGNRLTVTENRRVNLRVLGLSAGQGIFAGETRPFPTPFAFFPYRNSIPAARFTAQEVPEYAHNDVVASTDPTVPDLIIGFINGM
jgi:hypothetical protein